MRLRLLPYAAAGAVLLAACGSADGSGGTGGDAGPPRSGGEVVFSVNIDAQSIDAVKCGQNANWGPCQAVYGTLLNVDPGSGQFEPGMAESFTSDDGKVWTLTLRTGITFTDGTPFDAGAVVFNWDRAKDPANLSPGGAIARSMTYEAVDPRTVRVTLPTVNWQLPWALYSELAFIGSPTAVQRAGADFANAPVGAGPFVLESWQRGTRMTLDRNAGYWDRPRPYLDRIVFAPIGPDDQRLNALRSGDVDIMVSLLDEHAERATREGFLDHTLDHVGGSGLRFNFQQGPLVDPDVRLAVAKLIDAQQISEAFYDGAAPATTWVRDGSRLYDPDAVFPRQDVAGAQALIDGYLARTGASDVTVTYKLVGGIPVQDQVAQMVQAQVQRVRGLHLQIVPLEIATYLTDFNKGDFELAVASINGVNPDVLYLYFHSGAAQNYGGYADPATDAALDRARGTPDTAEQLAAYREATKHVAANLGQLSWRYQTTHILAREAVHGIVPSYSSYLRSELVWTGQE